MSTTTTQIQPKPIPALYTVYILRSQPRHASLYIGSTPHPPRRLSQHNGLAKGGAYRTSKISLRPWNMVCLVSGFPSMIAALKFEWALNNPHKSLHIPAEKRAEAVKGLGRRKTGHLKRPRKSLVGVMEALRMLVGVRSFGRWPLRVHFFEEDVWRVWERGGWKAKSGGGGVGELGDLKVEVVTDFGSPTAPQGAGVIGMGEEAENDPHDDDDGDDAQDENKHGIYALPLDYAPIKDYVAKSQEIWEFERQGSCVVCKEAMVAGRGLYAICPNTSCEAVGHLDCWSRCLLKQETRRMKIDEGDEILPVKGECPKCHGEVLWGDMMKELTLRIRGQAEVEKLLKKKKRRRAAKGKEKGKGKVADEKGNNAEGRNTKGNREVKTTPQRVVEDSEDSEFLDIACLQ
ncbi:structure-specific endonuclease subunit SLX1 [Neurospora crassa]|uniref:Structure-specific endonuclease subunit slx1 n=1 Tax=Neurospora crassa (strain ATCC 24698 / 74-OR23-1A / CBS 708.71 / DSM 1257 / FGSC 987) TaxID=367110 RepID=SLX1_NEUCR|nr:GIY-YIG catalytic domain-containing protein [Neurospora crassa OR74A]Q9P737.1 RecName: Full=Structure-specific endonuclease subunit slx1 [Neurospora crassa OR74A]EAA32366.1 GIY-YIG catalytic domain-containing protein [Neurospora crassa OR74A]KHE87798.1 structure-specific endonuclease subunit SLX1 [Neurospora crassa]CAB88545.1 conserved hypothetical protein [Neurospora crassa]|eukprot:XP_961602.1 GIY-YIG catalytic domain-containing protein [Neurospora crassa OR74A]